jgi:hypothetical protein
VNLVVGEEEVVVVEEVVGEVVEVVEVVEARQWLLLLVRSKSLNLSLPPRELGLEE